MARGRSPAVDDDIEASGDDLEADGEDGGVLDRLRQMPVGVTDPNIIGDAGPTDIPPGSDPPAAPEDEALT